MEIGTSRIADYGLLSNCRGAALVNGGGKGCSWGCLGLGDCERVCSFKAIHMSAHSLPIVDTAKCTACGDCVDVCPKGLNPTKAIGKIKELMVRRAV